MNPFCKTVYAPLQTEANKVRNADKLAQDNQQMRQQLQQMEQQKLALENQLLRQKLSQVAQQTAAIIINNQVRAYASRCNSSTESTVEQNAGFYSGRATSGG
jgi:regulator of replication initiation timing